MKSRIALAVALVLLALLALGGIKALQFRTMATQAFTPQPETIASATVTEQDWPGILSAIGTVAAVQGVNVTTELPGTVKEIAFQSGASVAAGDLLIRLDTSAEEAQLRSIEAQVDLAKLNADRVGRLRAADTSSQADLDTAEATLKQYRANADTIRAAIEKKTIRAPFAGRLGIRLVNLGEYLDTGKPIVSLQSLTPIHVDFSLPQQNLAQLKSGLNAHLSSDTFPDRQFEGTVTAINPDLDASTRSVRVQATVANEDQALRPGMFVRVEVILPSTQPVLVIPLTSVLKAPFGDSVFVVEPGTNSPPGLVARQQIIRTGAVRGDYVSVLTGLKAGQKVVSAGQFKLRNGMSVSENNELAPKISLKPHPADS